MDIRKAHERFLVKVAVDTELNHLRVGLVIKLSELFQESLLETQLAPKPKVYHCVDCGVSVDVKNEIYGKRRGGNIEEFGVICKTCLARLGVV